jgi:hypothetical protein
MGGRFIFFNFFFEWNVDSRPNRRFAGPAHGSDLFSDPVADLSREVFTGFMKPLRGVPWVDETGSSNSLSRFGPVAQIRPGESYVTPVTAVVIAVRPPGSWARTLGAKPANREVGTRSEARPAMGRLPVGAGQPSPATNRCCSPNSTARLALAELGTLSTAGQDASRHLSTIIVATTSS